MCIVWSGHVEVHCRYFGIIALQGALLLHDEIVTNHGEKLNRVDFFAAEANFNVERVVADSNVVASLYILAKVAESFLYIGVDDIIVGLCIRSIVPVVYCNAETILAVTCNAGDDTCGKSFEPSAWSYFEINAMIEILLASVRMLLFAIFLYNLPRTCLWKFKRHGIATGRNEIHRLLVFHIELILLDETIVAEVLSGIKDWFKPMVGLPNRVAKIGNGYINLSPFVATDEAA